MREMIIVLAMTDMATLGSIRTWPNLLVAVAGDDIWVRGIPPDTTAMQLRKLPVKQSFLADVQERLFLPGKHTPHTTLKKMSWEAIASFIKVELPVSAMPARSDGKYAVRLSTAAHTTEPSAILTRLEHWKAYADTAPLIRLQRLNFAVCGTGEVLIIGTPLPAIPGKAFTLRDHILLPAGYDFDPPVIGQFISSLPGIGNDALILFHTDGQWEKIAGNCFVHASRSAIRLTNTF
jgi:hypothetical protein